MRRNGFTLIEMMIVLIIIGILASFITAAAINSIEDAKKDRAKSTISAISTACAMYESDVGSYLPNGSGNQFKHYLQDDRSGDTSGWNGPYMNFVDEELSAGGTDPVLDPWDQAYNYQTGAGINNDGFVDIWTTRSGQTICNW